MDAAWGWPGCPCKKLDVRQALDECAPRATLGNGLVEGGSTANVVTNASGAASVDFVPGIEPNQQIDVTGPGVAVVFGVSGHFGGAVTAVVDGVQSFGE